MKQFNSISNPCANRAISAAKSIERTWGGYSHTTEKETNSSSAYALLSENNALITRKSPRNHPLVKGQRDKVQGTRGQSTQWLRYVAALLLVFFAGIGNVWGTTTVWESEMVSSISGVTQTKLNDGDSWVTSQSLSWAPGYTNAYKVSGSNRGVTLAFDESLELKEGDIIRLYVGSSSASRTFSLFFNNDNSATITHSLQQTTICIFDYELTSDVTLSSFTMKSSGSNTYIFKVSILSDRPATGETTISYNFGFKSNHTDGTTSNAMSTISGLSTTLVTCSLTIDDQNGKERCTGEIIGHPTSESTSHYVDLQFTVADGYTFSPSSTSFKWTGNANTLKAKVSIFDGVTTVNSNESQITNTTPSPANAKTITFPSGAFDDVSFIGTVHIRVYMWSSTTGKRAYLVNPFSITGTVAKSCSAPAAPTISGTEEYTAGDEITLTASHDGSNHDASTTYTWYKGADWATASAASPVQEAATGSSGYTFTKASCVEGDAGTYWCEAANSTCTSHNSTGKAITVSAAAKAYTVTAETNDEDWGTAEASASTADEGDEIEITATPEDGYKFVEWSVSGTGSELSSTTTNPTTLTVGTADVTVTATFRALYTYTISYNAGSLEGATGSKDSESKTEDAAFTLPSSAVFSCDGYTQIGWNTNTDGASGDHYDLGGSYTTNAAQTFYPEWKVNTPTISYNIGTSTVTITVPGSSTVRYTTDGTDPTTSVGTVYSEAFVLDETSTVKAIAYQSGLTTSEIASQACPVCVEPDEYTNEIARFFIPCGLSNAGDTKSAWNVTNQESSTGANTFTTSSFAGSGTNWNTNATTGLIYGKFSSDGTYVSLKLKSGNFKAGDIVSAYVNSTSNTLKFSKSSNTFGSAKSSGLTGEYVRSATLVAGDIEDDGSIKIMRTGGVSVNRIIVVRNGHAITKSATNGTIATTNSSSVAISAAKADETVYIAATPNTGYTFTSWSIVGDESEEEVDVTESAGVYSFTMPEEPVTVAATFTAINYTITHSAASNGSYTIQVASGSAVSTNTTANYDQTITLAATPNSGYVFDHWIVTDADEGTITVTNNTFTMPAKNVTVSATFIKLPNIYYYKDATRYTGSTYKAPDGGTATLDDNQPINSGNEWTVSNTIAGIIVKAKGCQYDGKGTYMNAYLKVPTGGNATEKYVSFTIATGCKASSLKIKIGGYSSNPTVTLKPLVNSTLGDAISYSGSVGGVATTEDNFNALTWSNLAAGTYILNVTTKNAYISEMSTAIEYLPVEEDKSSWAAAFATPPTLEDDITLGAGGTGDPITITIANGETAKAKSITLDNAKLEIAAGGALIVADGIDGASAEALTLGSSLENGNATLIYDVTTGLNATVEMASKATTTGTNWTWQYIGSPVNGVHAEDMYTNGYMYKWNNGWSAVAAKDNLEAFAGYCVTYNGAGHVFEMSGALTETDDISIDVAAETAQVIGNSWTAPIQIKQMDASDFNQVEQTIYLFNTGSDVDGTGGEAGSSDRYAAGTYQVLPISSVKSGAITYTTSISALQGFFVKNESKTNGSVTLNYAKHVRPEGENSVINGPMHAPKRITAEDSPIHAVAKLTVSGTRYDDQLILIEHDSCSAAFDNGYDGEKIGESSVSPWVYAVRADGTHDAVSATNDLEGTVIGFRAGTTDSQYTMHFDYSDEAEELYLYDTETNTYTQVLTDNTYTFTTSDKEEHPRFTLLRANAPQIATGVENVQSDDVQCTKARKVMINGELFILRAGHTYNAAGILMK